MCLGLKVLMFIAFPMSVLLVSKWFLVFSVLIPWGVCTCVHCLPHVCAFGCKVIPSFFCFDPLRCLHLCSLSPPYSCLGLEVFTLISIAFPPIDVFDPKVFTFVFIAFIMRNRRLCWTSRYMAMRISMDTISHSVHSLGAFGFDMFMFVFLAFLPCLGSWS